VVPDAARYEGSGQIYFSPRRPYELDISADGAAQT
jgi:hypothetical protein